MALEPIGDIADVSFSTEQEILLWETETDWRDSPDRSGYINDAIGDHPGVAKAAPGYHYGSLTRDLILYYPLDEGSGTTAGDETELGNDGTINGATWNGSGKIGDDALSFDGTDDDVDTGTPLYDGAGDMTWAVWINKSSWSGSYENLIADYNGGVSTVLQRDQSNNQFRFRCHDGTDTANAIGSTNIADGSYHHVAGIKRGSDIELWIDAGLDGSDSNASVGDTSSGVNIIIGSDNSNNTHLSGLVDEFRYFNRALSPTEISALHALTAPSPVVAGDAL